MASILDNITKIVTNIAGRITSLRGGDNNEYFILDSIREALLLIAEELAHTNGTNSDIVTEKNYKSRPIPACHAYRTASVIVPANFVEVQLAFTVNEYDDLATHNDKMALFHSETVNTTKFYAHEEGKYHFVGNFTLEMNDAGPGYIGIVKTNTAGNRSFIARNSQFFPGIFRLDMLISADAYLFPGEYVELVCLQDNTTHVNATIGVPNDTEIYPNFFICGRI